MTRMTQYTSDPAIYQPEAPFQASNEQEERVASLKRFNRLYVYLPIGVTVFTAVVCILLLLIGVFSPGLSGAAEYASALADLTIILFTIPLTLLCSIGPLSLLGIILFSRNRRQQGKPRFDNGGQIQILLWKMDNFIRLAQAQSTQTTSKIVRPVIEFNAGLAYITAFLRQIQSYIKRS